MVCDKKGESMAGAIFKELKEHSPFTLFGAMTGVLIMMVFRHLPHDAAYGIFYVLHPSHVFFSALVTTAVYCRYKPKARQNKGRIWKVLLIGFVGSVGIGTLSDSLIPLWGEHLMEMGHPEAHIGFIEEWWIINPAALAGIMIGYKGLWTRFPHAIHVLLSTWASLFHMMMARNSGEAIQYFGVFIFLFLAVWVPCCMSDIVFPLLFVKGKDHVHDSGCLCGRH